MGQKQNKPGVETEIGSRLRTKTEYTRGGVRNWIRIEDKKRVDQSRNKNWTRVEDK